MTKVKSVKNEIEEYLKTPEAQEIQKKIDAAKDVKRFYNYFEHIHPTEIRVFDDVKYPNGKSIFVNNEEDFIKEVIKYQDEGVDVYIGGRDRTGKGDDKVISSDFIFFEIDEHDLKKPELKEKVENFLKENNIEIGMSGFSGGGFHFYIPHSKKFFNIDEDRDFYKKVLTAFKNALLNNRLDIDTAVFNLERVSRILGSYNFKRKELSKIIIYNKNIDLEKNHQAIKDLILKYEEPEAIDTKVNETAIELLEKYKINETDKWLYDMLKNKIVIKEDTGGNSIVFKNTAIILTRENISKEEREVIAKAVAELCEGRTLSALYGWIKKCEANEIFENYTNEFNKFIRDNNYPLTQYNLNEKEKEENRKFMEAEENKDIKIIPEKEISNKENPFKKLHYSTEHLPKYHQFNSLIGLYGRHYIPLIKARYYQLIGGIIQSPVRLGSLETDTRIHIAYPLVTEGGKNELIYVFKYLIEKGIRKGENIFRLFEPISYSAESLVGKYVEKTFPKSSGRGTEKRKVENRGCFNNDFLEFDECTDLITSKSPEDSQAREYISKSENPIGKNKVEKRLVDDLMSEIVAYYPENTNSFYFQPFKKIPEEAMLQGFMRRKLIPVGDVMLFLNSADEKLFGNKLSEPDFSREQYKEELVDFLQDIADNFRGKEFLFTDGAKETINQYAVYLNAQGDLFSEKISNYCKLSKWSSLSNLVKMSVIIASVYNTNIVNENAVALAFMDLVELMQNTFEFIDRQVLGDFDYGTKWQGVNYYEKECLKYLYERNALSFDSSEITIEEFLVEAVMPIFKVKEHQARNRYLEMKQEKKLIDSKQFGKTDSRVWLNFNPNLHKNTIEGDKGFKGFSTYNTLFQARNGIVRAVQSLKPLKPLDETQNKLFKGFNNGD